MVKRAGSPTSRRDGSSKAAAALAAVLAAAGSSWMLTHTSGLHTHTTQGLRGGVEGGTRVGVQTTGAHREGAEGMMWVTSWMLTPT